MNEKELEAWCDKIPRWQLEKAKRPILEQRRINVDLPIWMVDSLDRESTRLGVTRQSVIKVWLDEKLRDLDEG